MSVGQHLQFLLIWMKWIVIYSHQVQLLALNLAAVAAEASRLWEEYDSAFAAKCLAAAEKCMGCSSSKLNIFAPMEQGPGGGAYGDDYVEDDYWAAWSYL